MPSVGRAEKPILSALVGVVVAGVVVAAGLGAPPVRPHGTLAFDGVNLTISYTGVWPGLFGPVHQNSCNETVQPYPGFSGAPACPSKLTGGNSYEFPIFELFAPINVTTVFINGSVSSPIPLVSFVCFGSLPLPESAPQWNVSQAFPTGFGCGWAVVLQVPNPAPTIPGGLWMDANLTVHIV